jgi:hypothetical protein
MKLMHHGIYIGELPDDWWAEAGMIGFVPISKSYCVEQSSYNEIQEVNIANVAPLIRNPIFRDGSNGEGTAQVRVVRTLRNFRLEQRTPPVEVVENGHQSGHRYKLVHGAHRFYCALAAGFTHVPTVKGFDFNALDN